MLLSGAIHVKKFKESDLYFICEEAKAGTKSKAAKLCDPWPSKLGVVAAFNSTNHFQLSYYPDHPPIYEEPLEASVTIMIMVTNIEILIQLLK